MELVFRCTGGPFGDCTCNYEVIPVGEFTLREFIDHVRTKRKHEWGSIRVSDNPQADFFDFKEVCEYRRETTDIQISNQEVLDQFSDRIIESIKANGGWSLMSYDIIVRKE